MRCLLLSSALGIVLLAIGSPNSADAQSVVIGGDVAPNTVASPDWAIGGPLDVGDSGTGTLDVKDGGTVSDTVARIGRNAGSVGTATVAGGGSTWTNSSRLYVGDAGTGTLNVEDGGAVSNTVGYIGYYSVGTATVTGPGSTWTNSGGLSVGINGTGTLNVEAGGNVINTFTSIGTQADGIGTATVAGGGSTWTNSSQMTVGEFGNGTLNVTDGGTVASSSGTIAWRAGSTGTVAIAGSDSTWTNDGVLYVGNLGSGALTIAAAGTVTNTDGAIGSRVGSDGTVTVSGVGSTWTNNGLLKVGNAGTGTLQIMQGGEVTDTESTIGSQAGAIGTAAVTGVGSAWTNSNALVVGAGGTGTLSIANGGTVSVGGGTGTLTLASQANSTGTLNIGAASGAAAVAAGTLDAALLQFGAGTGTVVFNHTGTTRDTALQFAPGISGNGALVFEHGWTFLNGDNTGFTGTTNVTRGTFSVNGMLGGVTTVASGSRLQGSGTVGTTVLSNGATLAPGNSIGTLNVNGDLTFAGGSVYEVEIASNGSSDKVVVSGIAHLNGAGVSVIPLDSTVSYQNGQTYSIVEAGTIDGTLAVPTIAGGSAFLTPSLTYGATTVTLKIATATTSSVPASLFVTAAGTGNQFAAASGLDGLPQTPGSASLALYNAILFSSAPNARIAFDQLSGEAQASVKTGQIDRAHFIANTAVDRLDAAFTVLEEQGSDPVEGSVALASTGIEAWISGFGSWGETDGNGNAASLDRDIGGFLVGADGFLTETLRVGLMAGYSEASYDVNGRGSSTDVDSTHIGIYAGTLLGAVELKAGASYSFNEIDTSREITFSTFRDSLTTRYDSGTAQVFGEASYRFDSGFGTSISPFANLTYVSLDTDGFAERGGAAALRSNGDTTETTVSTLGVKGQAAMPIGGLAVNASGTLGWRHAYDDSAPTSTLAFVAGGPAFTVSGAPIAQDAAVVELGLGIDVAPNATIGLHYAGQFAEDATDNGLRATFGVKF